MTKRPFTTKGVRAKEYLNLVHIDVHEPFDVQACEGHEYFITFTYDLSRYGMFTLCIGNSIFWINSRNLRRNRRTG